MWLRRSSEAAQALLRCGSGVYQMWLRRCSDVAQARCSDLAQSFLKCESGVPHVLLQGHNLKNSGFEILERGVCRELNLVVSCTLWFNKSNEFIYAIEPAIAFSYKNTPMHCSSVGHANHVQSVEIGYNNSLHFIQPAMEDDGQKMFRENVTHD